MLLRTKITCLFFALGLSAFSQNPVITQAIAQMNSDSLLKRANEISGAIGVTVGGVTDTIKSRHKSKPGNELAYRYIQQQFASYGLQVDSMVFSTTGKNAIAIQPGLVYPNQYYIICGHFDSMPNALISPAADDDGSGTAAVLEIARILSNYDFEYTIVYAIWDEEEQGLVGSNAYASQANSQNDSLIGVLNMDAIAWDGNGDNAAAIHMNPVGNGLALGSSINTVNNDYAIGLDLIMINPGATFSDHAAFWSNGFGAILLIEDWGGDSNPHYHTATDLVTYFNVPYYLKTSTLGLATIATWAVPYGATSTHTISSSDFDINLYPNPANHEINLLPKDPSSLYQWEIYDCTGKKVLASTRLEQSTAQINCSSLENGLYIVNIISGQQHVKKSLLITH